MNKPKILWLSDNPFTNTGFSSQSLFLMNGLAERGWECHYLGHNYIGQSVPPGHIKLEDGTIFNFWLHGNGREAYGQDLVVPYIQNLRPNVYGVLLDTFMIWPRYIQQNYAPAKTTWWIPSDGGGGLPNFCENILTQLDLPIPMSKYCERQLRDYHKKNTQYIPHAVNHELFKPLSEQQKNDLRTKHNLSDKFVVGVVGRNQGRKMMDRIFKAFAIFAKRAPNAILFCHTDMLDSASHFNMDLLIKRYHLQNRTIFTGMRFFKGFSYEQMNNVYNCFDVYLSTTSGEGFGICTLEAMSCEIPVILPDYTTGHELVIENGQCGEVTKLSGTEDWNLTETMLQRGYTEKDIDLALSNGTLTGSWTVERGVVCINDTANKLEKLYKDAELRKKYGKMGREKVLKYYTWPIIIEAWDKKLRGLIA